MAGSIKNIKCYWDPLNSIAQFFSYYPNASKSHIVVKIQYLQTARVTFGNTKVSLTSEGMRHLGTVTGSDYFKEKCVSDLEVNFRNQLELLSKIAETEPQSAYADLLVVL